MASTITPYIIVGLSILASSAYLLSHRHKKIPTSKQTPIVDQKLHDDLVHGRLVSEGESCHQKLALPDGRTLGYAIYGTTSSEARTIFFIHGFGDNRLTGGFFASSAEDLGARLISIDRPGWGLSSTKMGVTVLDVAEDIKYLASYLDAKQYSVMGTSGGGPATLACAYALPKEQLKGITMLIASGPWYETTMRHVRGFVWLFWSVMCFSPGLLRWMNIRALKQYRNMPLEEYLKVAKQKNNGWFMRLLARPHEKDQAIFDDGEIFRYSYDLVQENCKRGDDVQGMIEDFKAMTAKDLGFKVEDIRKDLPVQLWYGKFDQSVSYHVGEDLKRMLGDQATLHVRDETHASMLVYSRPVLEKALEDLRK